MSKKECVNERKEVQGGERLKEGSVEGRAGFNTAVTVYSFIFI